MGELCQMHSGGGGSYRAVKKELYRWMDGWTGNNIHLLASNTCYVIQDTSVW